MSILRLDHIVKTYDNHVAVNGVSFEVPQGKIFGLLGPNGAGKTSLIRIITTITRADSGTVYFNGEVLNNRHPDRIGYMPEERGLYRKMKVGDHLMYLGQLKGLSRKAARSRITYWFEKFDIEDWWSKKVEELSKGMQQKIQFIATVLHQPQLLILDEPFSGLDPINTNLIKDEIYALNQAGVSIIFSTHRMEQVEEICEYIVLISKGENVLEGEVARIKNRFKQNRYEILYRGELPAGFAQQFELVESGTQRVVVQLNRENEDIDLLRYLVNQGVHLTSFQEILPRLNEIFIGQVGEEARKELMASA